MTDKETAAVEQVGDIPLCPGCGLASHITHGDICVECFQRREGWLGGGPKRVVTSSGTYHETALCPAVRQASKWYYWRDESCMHADLGGRLEKCSRCHAYRTFGFDHYRGRDKTVIGHA